MSPLKRKAGLPQVTPQQLKHLRLDPAPKQEDVTIMHYHQRVQACLPEDRDNLQVLIPFDGISKGIKELKNRIEGLEKTISLESKRRLAMLQANAFVDLVNLLRKEYETVHSDDHSTNRLQRFATKVTDAQLSKMNIPAKAWPHLRNLEKVIERRNTAAHETKGDFAHLLLSDPFRGTHPYELWKDLFPILYGASIELVAAQEDADLRDQIGL